MAVFDPVEAALGRYLSVASPGPAGLSALDEIVAACGTARMWMEDNPCPSPTIRSLLLEHNDVYLAIVEEFRSAGAGADHDLVATAQRLAALAETKERLDDAIEKWTPDG